MLGDPFCFLCTVQLNPELVPFKLNFDISFHPSFPTYLGSGPVAAGIAWYSRRPGVPWPDEVYNPSTEFWVCRCRRHPGGRCRYQLSWLLSTWGNSELLPDARAPHPDSKAEPRHCRGENVFQPLVSAITPAIFLSLPSIMSTCEGWKEDRQVNPKLCLPSQLPLQHSGLAQRCLQYCQQQNISHLKYSAGQKDDL